MCGADRCAPGRGGLYQTFRGRKGIVSAIIRFWPACPYGTCRDNAGEEDEEGVNKLEDVLTKPARVVEIFDKKAESPFEKDTRVILLQRDLIEDPANVIVIDIAADMNVTGWDIRKRYFWYHPGLEDWVWKQSIKVRGEMTEWKTVYIMVTRTRWTPQHGTKELDTFLQLTSLFKDIRDSLEGPEVAMTLPSIPSLYGRRLQVAQCVTSAARGTGLCVRLYQSF